MIFNKISYVVKNELFLRSEKEFFCRNSVLMRVYYSTYVVCEKPGFILRGRLHNAMYSGISISTGSFLIVGGSLFRKPDSIWASRGIILSWAPAILVGLFPKAKAIVVPTAVSALVTDGAVIWRFLP